MELAKNNLLTIINIMLVTTVTQYSAVSLFFSGQKNYNLIGSPADPWSTFSKLYSPAQICSEAHKLAFTDCVTVLQLLNLHFVTVSSIEAVYSSS